MIRDNNFDNSQSAGKILLYQAEDGRTLIECRFENETLWVTQAQMAELFQTTPQNITLHLKALYAEGEQAEEATCKSYLQVRREGERTVERQVRHYRLEVVLAVGFRVRSARGTQFRQWATARLQEYLLKGFVMDDERLKNPPGPGVGAYQRNKPDWLRLLSNIKLYEKVQRIIDHFFLAMITIYY